MKQSQIAESLHVDASRISRIETGQLLPDLSETARILDSIGTEEAKDYASYCQENWGCFEKPSFWHPSRRDLARASAYAVKLEEFVSRPQTTEAAKAQADLHRQSLTSSAEFLRTVDHAVAFVGDIGVGKSTAICGLTGLLLPPDPKAPSALSKRVVLETGSGRTTLCEVRVRSEGKTTFALVVQPHSEEEVFRSVSDFSASITDALNRESIADSKESDLRGVSEELNKALRNMAGLARKTVKNAEGKMIRHDPAFDLARQYNNTATELTAEILKRMRLDKRNKTEFRFEAADLPTGLSQLRQLFANVNKGLSPDVSLPRRIDLVVPLPLLGENSLDFQVIDTKGVDDTAIRPDIRAYLDDARTVTVLCSRFDNAPGPTLRILMENLVSTGAERVFAERMLLLVLARSAEVLETQDDEGNRAETAEEAYRIKGDQIRWELSKVGGAADVPIMFLDVLNDDHHPIADQLVSAASKLRDLQSQRISEVGQAIDELIKRHGEVQTKEAQEKVRRRLRIFIEQHLAINPAIRKPYRELLSTVQNTHPRTVWASTRRNGSWTGLDAYHLIGVGTVIDAQSRSQSSFAGLDELLNNMLGDQELEPARDYLNELRRIGPEWRQHFLNECTTSGREIYRAALFPDDQIWDQCIDLWGTGSGYRNRVAEQLETWCDSHPHLSESVEKRIQLAWQNSFLKPLAILCDSTELLD